MKHAVVAGMVLVLVVMALVPVPGHVMARDAGWTYMVYMSGDSSMADLIADDIREMQEVGSDGALNIIVLSDSSGMGDSKLARITRGGQEYYSLGDVDSDWKDEVDMGQADTLSEFVLWAASNFPAEHYALDLWGHGRGWSGICPDRDNYLEAGELREAVLDIQAGGIHLDLVSMDACQMGMLEVMYELRGAADYAVASEKDVPLAGWSYDVMLGTLKANTSMGPGELGRVMIDAYFEWGMSNSGYSLTLALIDLGAVEDLAGALDDYAAAAESMVAYFNPQFIGARAVTERYDGNAQYDLAHLLEGINRETDCRRLEVLAGNVSTALGDAVVYNRHWTNPLDEPADNASGLSIWFPAYTPTADYLATGLAADTAWDEFLEALAPFFGSPARQEVVLPMTVTGQDADGDGLKDSLLIAHDASTVGTTQVELYSPSGELVLAMPVDMSSPGSQLITLDRLGSYQVAAYVWGSTGHLRNYTLFSEGLAREGLSVITGTVRSETGRGLAWVRVTLVDDLGNTVKSTNTDGSGRYRLDIIVPTDTPGGNFTLVFGLGDGQRNVSIGALAETRTVDIVLEGGNPLAMRMLDAGAALVVAGALCLLVWALLPRRPAVAGTHARVDNGQHVPGPEPGDGTDANGKTY